MDIFSNFSVAVDVNKGLEEIKLTSFFSHEMTHFSVIGKNYITYRQTDMTKLTKKNKKKLDN